MDGVEQDMLIKEQTTFTDLCVEDFGLRPTDEDSHVPQFFMVTKLPKTDRSNFLIRSSIINGTGFAIWFRTYNNRSRRRKNHDCNTTFTYTFR